MKHFNIKTLTTQLRKINKESGKDVDAGIQLILNNLEIYNFLLAKFELGDLKQVYLLYQMSMSIFKQLASYNIYPDKKSSDVEVEDDFIKMKKTIEKR